MAGPGYYVKLLLTGEIDKLNSIAGYKSPVVWELDNGVERREKAVLLSTIARCTTRCKRGEGLTSIGGCACCFAVNHI